MNKFTRSYSILFISIVLGIITGLSGQKTFIAVADTISTIFINFLSMIAAPIVFLAIVSTLVGMKGFEQMRSLGKKVLTYTLLTTVLAAVVALVLFLVLDPVAAVQKTVGGAPSQVVHSYLPFLIDIVPSNIFKAFLDNRVISIAFLGFLLGITAHYLPEEPRKILKEGFSALFQLFLKVASIIT